MNSLTGLRWGHGAVFLAGVLLNLALPSTAETTAPRAWEAEFQELTAQQARLKTAAPEWRGRIRKPKTSGEVMSTGRNLRGLMRPKTGRISELLPFRSACGVRNTL